ncbi:MAG TPA: bifunctional phosphopantothenoylcysteine decarboxylase/phosphopantothenate--cysteine ligase CoaBC [Cytophagaceae bacterium]|nr:bifunctional phosphopantothenoylcysteine decarboxylase/phosphopantothenate--cysteine ligase CoaBC [Cytophagaceae bacterium]
MLRNKKILLGICGSIAAYKAAYLTRSLIKEGAEVQVVMTTSASEFISPLTLSTLSRRPAFTEFVKDDTGLWNNHVDTAIWADVMLIAPASANTIGKLAYGLCDNLLSAIYLSARCPVFIAPAMDLDMYKHAGTQANLSKLRSFGNRIIDAEDGELASGLSGKGRMAEPETIVHLLKVYFKNREKLKGRKVLVTAGPTYELIDPVRFIGNLSSGKMGYEIAQAFADAGAEVTLVSGPTFLQDLAGVKMVRLRSAEEMFAATNKEFTSAHITILAAAVADYTPKYPANQKIKKHDESYNLELAKTVDIAFELGKIKRPEQLLVGFALETENETENARKKLISKNLDMIILNSLNDEGAGFGHDTNKVSILSKDNKIRNFELKSKREVAADIVATIIEKFHV